MTSVTNHNSCPHPEPTVTLTTSTASRSIVSANFMQRPNTETERPECKILNNTLVTTNKVLSITWKLSVNHAPSHTQHGNSSGQEDHFI